MVDFHSHILYGVDDGASSFEETKKMLLNAKEEGTKYICASSHYIDGEFEVSKEEYKEKFEKIKEFGASIGLEVIPSLEIYLTDRILEKIEKDKIWGLGFESKYVLIELPMEYFPIYTEDVFFALRAKGINPIIAHPERNLKIINDISLLENLVKTNTLVQINSGSLSGLYGNTVKNTAIKLVEKNMVHLIGSDAHNSKKRNTFVSSSRDLVQKLNDEAYSWIKQNEVKIIKNENVNILPIKDLNRKSFFSRIFRKK